MIYPSPSCYFDESFLRMVLVGLERGGCEVNRPVERFASFKIANSKGHR